MLREVNWFAQGPLLLRSHMEIQTLMGMDLLYLRNPRWGAASSFSPSLRPLCLCCGPQVAWLWAPEFNQKAPYFMGSCWGLMKGNESRPTSCWLRPREGRNVPQERSMTRSLAATSLTPSPLPRAEGCFPPESSPSLFQRTWHLYRSM